MKNEIVIFKELTTEESIREIVKQSQQYVGLVVDMNKPDERKKVKESAALITGILKKIDRARIDMAKDYKAKVEAEAGFIVSRLEAANKPLTQLIDAHAEEQRKIREAEKERQATIQAAFDKLNDSALEAIGQTSTVIEVIIEDIQSYDFDREVFQERTKEAIDKQRELLGKLDQMLKGAIAQEETEAKLAKLAAMEEAQRIAEEAEAQAKRDAEIAAQAREEAEANHAKQLAEAAENAKLESERQEVLAKQRAEDAAKAERERILAEQARMKEEEDRRQANKKHAAKVHGEIMAALASGGISEADAKAVVALAAKKLAGPLYIQY